MYKQDLEQTLLDIDEEAELEIGPRDDRPSVVLVGGSAFMLNDVTNRSVTHDIDVFEADRCLREIIARYPEVNGMAVACWPRRLRSGVIKRWSAHTGNTKRRCSVESDF